MKTKILKNIIKDIFIKYKLNNKKEIKKLITIAKKDFNKLTEKYGMMCKQLVENQKQRIDYWENKGNKKIK